MSKFTLASHEKKVSKSRKLVDSEHAANRRTEFRGGDGYIRKARAWTQVQADRLSVEPDQISHAIRCRFFPEQIERMQTRADFDAAMTGRSPSFELTREVKLLREASWRDKIATPSKTEDRERLSEPLARVTAPVADRAGLEKMLGSNA